MNPEPPTFHFGTEKRLRGLVAELDGYADAIKHERASVRGKTRPTCWRVSCHTLTMPRKTVTQSGGERSLAWLHKRYGPHLVAVIEHQDEANPHLHFYAIEPEGLT